MSYYVNPHGHNDPWFPYAEQFGAPNLSWCEAHLGNWIDQPANAYSNLAYLLVALGLIWFARRSKQKELLVYTSLLAFLAIASFTYHISNNYLTQFFDFIGMFALLFWMIALNFRRLNLLPPKKYLAFTLGGVGVFGLLVHLMYVRHLKYQLLIVFLVVVLLGQEYLLYKSRKAKPNYRFLSVGAGFMFIAAIFSALDITGVMCNPNDHLVQGHALWHIASAIGLGAVYFHYHQFNYLTGGLAHYRDNSQLVDNGPEISAYSIGFNQIGSTSLQFRSKESKKRKNLYDEDIESQLEP